jgi:hypothetical protein
MILSASFIGLIPGLNVRYHQGRHGRISREEIVGLSLRPEHGLTGFDGLGLSGAESIARSFQAQHMNVMGSGVNIGTGVFRESQGGNGRSLIDKEHLPFHADYPFLFGQR